MPEYKGKYGYGGEAKNGTLVTYRYFGLGDWGASFHFDEKEVPGKVIIGITEGHPTEKDAHDVAVADGFIQS